MRANLSHLIQVLQAQEPPDRIRQKPYNGDLTPYKRLIKLQGKAPSTLDLCIYSEDLEYGNYPLQADLLRYLLPLCLDAWRTGLFVNGYGSAFEENLWSALANRALLQEHLAPHQCAAVETFMANSILDALEQDTALSFTGMGARPYTLFAALGSFSVAFPSLPSLWQTWWEMRTVGHACAALQFLSCLLYEDDRNLIFAPWTPNEGGGPPDLWEVTGHFFDRGWRVENVAFLQATLTLDYVEEHLRTAVHTIAGEIDSPVPRRMLADFETQKPLLESRLTELPSILLLPSDPTLGWTL